MSEIAAGAQIIVLTPEGEVDDVIDRVIEPETMTGVALVETQHSGRVIIFGGVGYALPARSSLGTLSDS